MSPTMQAIIVSKDSDANADDLELTTVPIPELSSPYDILVKLHACALNPVDIRSRSGAGKILGYDGAGVVEKAGEQALFKAGDEVFYAGVIQRNGTNAQYHAVDSRIVGRKPTSVDFTEAAAWPLVVLTAWEMLEGHFGLVPHAAQKEEHTLLVVNGAGGVGSIATQLAKKVFGIKNVVATASRKETIDWVKRNGATHVINHHEELAPQLEKLGLTPSLAFLCYETDKTLTQVVPAMRAWGKIGSIVGTPQPIDFTLGAFHKALSFHYELMFARGLSGHDLEAQGRILNDAARLIDEGALQSLVTKREVLSLKTLREAHRQSESWTSIGKTTFTIPDKWE